MPALLLALLKIIVRQERLEMYQCSLPPAVRISWRAR